MAIKTSSAKDKGRRKKVRVCRRCRQDYKPVEPLQKVCCDCRTKCSSCGITLSVNNQDKHSLLHRKNYKCKSCVASAVRKTTSRENRKDYDLQRNYGITADQYKYMVEIRKGLCDICKKKPKKTLCVDHCHRTNNIRGLLCNRCNTAVGMLDDCTENLRSAIEYLSCS